MPGYKTIALLAGLTLGGWLAATAPAVAEDAAKAPKAAPPAAAKLELEPKAVEILKAVGNRLASAHTISFTAVETFESPSRQNVPLVYATKSNVVVQRPDKLRVIISGDGPPSEFYYDGKMMVAYAPVDDLVAVADAPPTIDAALEAAYGSAAIYFPFTDLIVADPYGDIAKSLQHAYYVGQSEVIGGTKTDIVAFAGNGVFVQMWVGAEDKLPRAMHAIYLNDPKRLRHNLMLSDWKIDAPIAADVFGTPRAKTAKKMPFAHPHPEKAPAKAAPAKTTP